MSAVNIFKVLFVLSVGLSTANIAVCQINKAPSSKQTKHTIKGDRFLYVEDDIYYIPNDTIIFLPDTMDVIVKHHSMEKTEEFYQNIKNKMSDRKVSKMVYKFIFKSPNRNRPHHEDLSELRFIHYDQDNIERLTYKRLAIFGSKMSDTSYLKVDKYTNVLNKIHFGTRHYIIRKNMMFRKGHNIKASDLVESERLIRRLPYVKDARIMVEQASNNKNAHVAVVTKDVFPYSAEINPRNDNNALFGISHINVGGIGHELEYNYIEDNDYELFYRIQSVFGSYIDIELDQADHFRKKGQGVVINRNFVTRETQYAGGIQFSDFRFGEYNYDPITDLTSEFFYHRHQQDIWLGRAFKTNLSANWFGFGDNTYMVASGRIDHQNFYDKPIVPQDSNYRYHDRTNYLVGLGISTREYFKDKFISNYGRTEDIPTGSVISLVTGFQKREFQDRVYIGTTGARGEYIPGFGYLNNAISLGGFVDIGGLRDGVFRGDLNYFTRLFTYGRYKFRQFVNFSFAQTINPTEDFYLRTQRDLGIRGVSSFFLQSTQRFDLNLESLLFTPAIFLGFRVAVFGFFDFAATGNSRSSFFESEHFTGWGGGVKFRNDNLAFSTIQLRYGFYPDLPINGQTKLIDLSTSTRVEIKDFDVGAPEIVPFR